MIDSITMILASFDGRDLFGILAAVIFWGFVIWWLRRKPSKKICPYCKESIKIDAIACPYCTRDLLPPIQKLKKPPN